MLHIVFQHVDVNTLQKAIELDESMQGDILEIKDDGQGMDPAIKNNKKNLGLIGIKERTFILGGQYELNSEPGKGTEIKITIPL